MPFNREQQAAIDLRDKTILVSAPAGSGKTRILVSRIDSLILNDHYHINEFLVLTFTDAAASEMKQRLNIQLHHDLKNPELTKAQTDHLNSCIDALPHAYISTFDSFCKTLLAKYGYLIGVMPGFEVLAVPDLLEKEVLDECIAQWIHEEAFQDYMNRHNIKNNFNDLTDLIKSFKSTTDSFVNFAKTLADFHQRFYEFDDINEASMLVYIRQLYIESLQDSLTNLNTLSQYAEANHIDDFFEGNEKKPSPADAYFDFLDEHLRAFKRPQTFDAMQSLLNDKPQSATTIGWKAAGIGDDVKETYNKLKKKVLEPFDKMKEDLYIASDDELKDILAMSYQDIQYLLGKGGLLERFRAAYRDAKNKQGYLDFHDLEDYATRLLDPALPVLSTLNRTFKEIMLDEYQDTNQIQENLVTKIAGQGDADGLETIPMFMVGDMKQSIYRFRQADPRIFKEKFETYTPFDQMSDQDDHIRIDLRFNYRSQKAVLDSINYIFDSIMDNEIGGLDYIDDPFAILRYDHAAKNKTLEELTSIHDYDSEVLIGLMDGNKDVKKPEAEAHMVAQRILKLKAQEGYDFKNICVLMRNTSDFITYKKIFEQYGIPANITLSRGLLESNEALSMIALLEAFVNPKDDIAMTSVLHNHFLFSDFDENEMLQLRDFTKENTLYDDLHAHQDDEKIRHFLEVFEALRSYAFNASPYDILKKCYEETGYVTFVSGLVNGEQRQANLDTLLELARSESDNYPYLPDFVEFLKAGAERSPGKIFSDDNDAVEFMTIHKSKGLQFKVVFVSGMTHQFNSDDERNDILLDKDKGIASRLRFYKDSAFGRVLCELDHPYRQMIRHYIHKEAVNEEMRILYVALTRAEDKMIMTGVLKDGNHIRDIARQVKADDANEFSKDVVYSHKLRNVNNYLDWILMAIMRHPDVQDDLGKADPALKNILKLKSKKFKRLNNAHTALARFHLSLSKVEDILANRTYKQKENQPLDYAQYQPYYAYQYPYPDHLRSVAVTTLQALEDEKHFDYLSSESLNRTAAQSLGTLVHNVLSYFSFDHSSLDDLLNALDQEGMFNAQEEQLIRSYAWHLNDFINSDIYQEIAEADAIYKEKAFRFKDEDIIINGIFDLVFIKDGRVSVLDYKTDHITNKISEKKLIKKHQLQLSYYKKVLSQYFNSDVKGYVFYLETGQCIEV